MKYTVIKSAEEFKRFYPYKSPPNPKPCPKMNLYPREYPCFCKIVNEGGGLGGEYMRVSITYLPKNCDMKSFKAGLESSAN